MKTYWQGFPAGLGDYISQDFSPVNYGKVNEVAKIFARMCNLYWQGKINAVAVHQGTNDNALDIFDALGIPTSREIGKDWIEAKELEPFDVEAIPFPKVQPKFPVPKRYILFNQDASQPDRCLRDPSYYRMLKDLTGLPIIKVGNIKSPRAYNIPCDIDLTNKTTVPETSWLVAHAALVVSAITFFRCFPQLHGTPVIEICEEGIISDFMLEKTAGEYRDREYGMFHDNRNRWFKMPMQKEEFCEIVKLHTKPVSRIPERKVKFDAVRGMQDHWHLSNSVSDKELMDKITSSTNFQPDINLLKWYELDETKTLRILDFGSGMLRNTTGLLSLSPHWHLTSYDTQIMLDRGVKHYQIGPDVLRKRLRLHNVWDDIKDQQFDAILCSLVLQHIVIEELPALVEEFKSMTDTLLVHGRRSLDDFKHEVWPVVLAAGWEPIKVKGNRHGKVILTIDDLYPAEDHEPHDHTAVIFKKAK